MILDKLGEFCDAASVVGASGATIVVGDVIDLGTPSRNLGVGDVINFLAKIVTGIVAAGAGTVTFHLTTADDAALTSSPVNLVSTAALVTQAATPAAGVAAGITLFDLTLPRVALKRYLGVRCAIAGNNVSAGAIDADLLQTTAANAPYPDLI
jgi:hypothetical protein